MAMTHVLIYGLLGWCIEVIWTGVGSLLTGDPRLTATTYLWMFPIYSTAVLFEPVHDAIRVWSVWRRGVVWMAFCFAVEYLTGWLLASLLGVAPWDYSGSAFHIHGLIRLDYGPAWFAAGLVFEKVHDWLDRNAIGSG